MIELRPKKSGDAADLLQVWRHAVDASHRFLTSEDRIAIDPLVADYVRDASLTVAVLEGRPVAFMGVSGSNIDSLFVDPCVKGRGIGRMMADSVGRPSTVDVNEQNTEAVAFYRHLGFEMIGRSPHDGDGRPYPLLHMKRD